MHSFPTHFKRLRLILVLLLSTTPGLFAQQEGDSPVKIFILVGQSNMLGHGEISPVGTPGTLEYTVANDPDGDYQFLIDGSGDWVVRDDVWIRDQDPEQGGLTVGYASSNVTVGPELGFGHKIGDLNEEQVLIVKAAWGGKSLAADFRPPSSGGTTGFYYNEVLRLVGEATSNLGAYFPDYDGGGYEIAGFGWHQGFNDRVNAVPGAADEYEVNLVNFINDIRSSENGLGVPDMPFVIATTGMGGGDSYTTVELAQLAMANSTTYPEFAGNVAVIDTRMPYEGLEFWQPVELSPSTTQGFHWNRNAKTYTNIGLAMGDAMSTLAPGRCPFRPRVVGGPDGITVSWQNGTETPTSVRVLRNGIEIAAAAPAGSSSFLDSAAQPDVLDYELQFTMPGDPCAPLSVSLNGAITGMRARPVSGGIELTWTNNMAYDAIEIRRNGMILEAALIGTATSYTDAPGPGTGLVTYSVAPTNGSSTPAIDQVNLNLAGQLGIMNPALANDGINPLTEAPWTAGDTYRLIGTTVDRNSAPRSDSSADIATYNDWVNEQATTYSTVALPWSDVTWFVVGSTPTVSARQNTGTDDLSEGAGSPILKLDGTTVVAAGNADLWSGSIASPIDISFDGTPPSSSEINTGTGSDGTPAAAGSFGDGDPNGDGKHGTGYANQSDGKWISGFSRDYRSRHYYAMSQVLTIQDLSSGVSFDDWIAGPWDGTLTDSSPELDFDGGGLKTGIEWVVGGDPTDPSDDVSHAPTTDHSDPTFFTFTHRISDEARADTGTTATVEYGSDLSGWTTAIDNDTTLEITTTDGTGVDEGFDLVSVRIDRSLAVDEKLFVRLKVFLSRPQ